jgi:hypothetical protein
MTQPTQRISAKVKGNATIRVVAYPSDSSVGCVAAVDFLARQVDPYVEHCMGTQMCLAEFGGNQAGFELRNNPQEQYDCLKGNIANASCTAFDTCLTKGGYKDGLLEILEGVYGATSGTPLLADIESIMLTKDTVSGSQAAKTSSAKKDRRFVRKLNHSMGSGCFNPYTIDPEAYDCECLYQDRVACKARGLEFSECMRINMCNNCEVCTDWKNDRCTMAEQQSAEAACAQENKTEEEGNDDDSFLHKDMVNHRILDPPADIKSESLFARAEALQATAISDEVDSAVKGKCTR